MPNPGHSQNINHWHYTNPTPQIQGQIIFLPYDFHWNQTFSIDYLSRPRDPQKNLQLFRICKNFLKNQSKQKKEHQTTFLSLPQVSGSKIWQMERSCMCCQESGEREAAVSLFCPKAKPGERKFRKVSLVFFTKVSHKFIFLTFHKKVLPDELFFFKGFNKSTVRMHVSPLYRNWRERNYTTRDCRLCRWRTTVESFSEISTSVIYL